MNKQANEKSGLVQLILALFIGFAILFIIGIWIKNADDAQEREICTGSVGLNQFAQSNSRSVLSAPILCAQQDKLVKVKDREQVGQTMVNLATNCWRTYGANNNDQVRNAVLPGTEGPVCWPCYSVTFDATSSFDQTDVYPKQSILGSFTEYGEFGLVATDRIPDAATKIIQNDQGIIFNKIQEIRPGRTYIVTYVDVDSKREWYDKSAKTLRGIGIAAIGCAIPGVGWAACLTIGAAAIVGGALDDATREPEVTDSGQGYDILYDDRELEETEDAKKLIEALNSKDGVLLIPDNQFNARNVPFCEQIKSDFDVNSGDD